MSSGRTRRVEAMMHALLVDHGYRRLGEGEEPGAARCGDALADMSASPCDGNGGNRAVSSPSPGRRHYAHAKRDAGAVLERVGLPTLPVAVTLYDDDPERPTGLAAKPEALRYLLERGY